MGAGELLALLMVSSTGAVLILKAVEKLVAVIQSRGAATDRTAPAALLSPEVTANQTRLEILYAIRELNSNIQAILVRQVETHALCKSILERVSSHVTDD